MKQGKPRNRILGIICAVWGGAVLLNALLGGMKSSGNEMTDAGQSGGLIFGGILFVVGLYYAIKG